MVDEHILDLVPAYALGALDADEYQKAARHLEVCQSCQAELDVYRQLTADLALAAPQRNPPQHLKARLMDQIHQPVDQVPSSWMQKLWARVHRLSPVWSLTSFVLILVLAVSNIFFWQQSRQMQSRLHTLALNNTSAAPNATGLLVLSVDGARGTLVVDGLPSLGESQQYQLWLIAGGQRTSGGVFSVGKKGYGYLWIKAPEPLNSYESFGITIEPYGGSPGPTGEKVLHGQF